MIMLREYYDRRAPEYDDKYMRDEPARQAEQSEIAATLRDLFAGKRVLEIACGTGFWTEVAARVAAHVVATDVSLPMLELARTKGIPMDRVEFRVEDAYDLASVPGTFDAGLANFWLSHVRRVDLARFLSGFHRRLGAGAVVFMCDDVYIPGVGGVLVQDDGDEDTYKRRWLADGSEYTIVKNYYDAAALRSLLSPYADGLSVHVGTCHWWVNYRVKRKT
jgi:SAM-dependent methyltransferase